MKLRQTRLEEFTRYKCPVCGRTFETYKGCNAHITKSHSLSDPPTVYPGEGLEVTNDGGYLIIKLRVKRSLWDNIQRRRREMNLNMEEFFFDVLGNMAAFGDEYEYWMRRNNTQKELTYIT